MADQVKAELPTTATPWLSMWFHPRRTIRDIITNTSSRYVLILAAAAGAAFAIDDVTSFLRRGPWSMGHTIDIERLGTRLIIGSLLGIAVIYLQAALVTFFGRMLGVGEASARDVRVALAWAHVPTVLSLIMMLCIYGFLITLEQYDIGNKKNYMADLLVTASIAIAILGTWNIVLAIGAVSVVHGFGIGRAALSLVFSAVTVFLVVSLKYVTFQPLTLSAATMAPTLQAGDYIFVNNYAYGYSRYSLPIDFGFSGRIWGAQPQPGDLISFRMPLIETNFVTRLIGMPGDRIVETRDGLIINGQPVQREELERLDADGRPVNLGFSIYRETLPNGRNYEIYSMPEVSTVDEPQAFTVPDGHYFVLDDNRDGGWSARYPKMDYVPYDHVLGRVSVIFFSWADGEDVRWERILKMPE